MIHDLKVWPRQFAALASGAKTFELRKDDRGGFAVGDSLHLREYDNDGSRYTGADIWCSVTYITRVGEWMPVSSDNFVVLGLGPSMHGEPPSTNAVDPIGRSDHGLTLRDVESSSCSTCTLQSEGLARLIEEAILKDRRLLKEAAESFITQWRVRAKSTGYWQTRETLESCADALSALLSPKAHP